MRFIFGLKVHSKEIPMLTYRHPTAEDIPKIDSWIAVDDAHTGLFKGSDFVLVPNEKNEIPKGVQCIEVSDSEGIIFYLKFKNALIVETQFPPASEVSHLRVARGLKQALSFFSVSSKSLGYHAMFFNSISESLIGFFERLGFKKLTDFFKVDL